MAGNRDPAACSKAVREAWANERELVLNGQGTRDWTPQQQADIVDGLVPRDDQGRPFEGHHMLSAEAYPQFQDDPENIQFLSRDEHQAAHDGLSLSDRLFPFIRDGWDWLMPFYEYFLTLPAPAD